MAKKSKGKMSLKKKIILTAVLIPVAVLLGILLFNLPKIIYFGTGLVMRIDTSGKKIDTTLTMDQKLSDFEYMYEIVCLGNPAKDEIEKSYGISYDEIHDTYREYVINSKTDYEYFSIMACFLAVLPGQHNAMSIPNYDKDTSSFMLTEIYAPQEFKDYAYSWREEFHNEVISYHDYGLFAFKYFDGAYYGLASDSTLFKINSDYKGGQLITLDGKDPKDMCFDFLSRNVPVYDGGNNCFYRDRLFFNDGIGTPHEAEILMPDGTIVITTIYEAAGYEIALADGLSAYPELRPSSDDSGSSASDLSAPMTYTIATDAERNLVYLESTSCDLSEAERLTQDLNQALSETDADTVIIDLRSNGGGSTDFVNEYILPLVFSHDVTYSTDVIGCKNSYTKNYYNNLYYRYYINRPLRLEGDHFIYREDFNVKGQAAKNYKIYILTSDTTFSSADLMTRICKDYDNAVIVGTYTQGEGISGTPFRCYLPNSRFMFTYTPTVASGATDDSFYGTEPDIFIPLTYDEYSQKKDLESQGVDAGSYEVRQMWDKTLIYVLGLVDNI